MNVPYINYCFSATFMALLLSEYVRLRVQPYYFWFSVWWLNPISITYKKKLYALFNELDKFLKAPELIVPPFCISINGHSLKCDFFMIVSLVWPKT